MGVDPTNMEAQHSLLLHGIVRRLESEFGDEFTHETIEHYVEDSYQHLASRAKVLTHIPTFVDRFSRQRLRSLAKNRGTIDDHPPVVLFVKTSIISTKAHAKGGSKCKHSRINSRHWSK